MIRYKKYQNKNEKNVTTFNKWYARAVCEETVDIAALAEHMSTHNTPFSTGAIHGMLKDGELYQGAADGRQEREDRRPRHLQRGHPLEGGRHAGGFLHARQYHRRTPPCPCHGQPLQRLAQADGQAPRVHRVLERGGDPGRWRERFREPGRDLGN